MKKHLPKVPVILVGTQTDLRNDLDVLVDLVKYKYVYVLAKENTIFGHLDNRGFPVGRKICVVKKLF